MTLLRLSNLLRLRPSGPTVDPRVIAGLLRVIEDELDEIREDMEAVLARRAPGPRDPA